MTNIGTTPLAPELAESDYKYLREGFISPKHADFSGIHIPDDADVDDALKEVKPVTTDVLTEANILGSGVFDRIMLSIGRILETQVKNGVLDKAVFGDVFTKTTTAALEQAVNYALNKDKAYVDAQTAVIANISAKLSLAKLKVDFETAKLNYELAFADGENKAADYVVKKMELAKLHSEYAVALEQWEAARAQTKETLSDGSDVGGLLGKQKQFVDAQIKAYGDRSKVDAMQLISALMQVKLADDIGLLPPNSCSNENFDRSMDKINTSVGLR